MIKKLAALALSTTCLIPFSALAEDDEFGISQEPVAAPAPTYLNDLELGAGYSSNNPLQARRFSGRTDDGLFPVGSLSYLYRTPYDVNGADFLRINGSSFGYDSRRLSVEGGEQGEYKLNFGYEMLPFSSFRGLSAWTGEGGDNLTRVPGWVTGNGTLTSNRALRHPVDIRTDRERFGTGMTWHIDPQYSMRIGARHEKKEGLRALGVNTSNNAAVNVPAPVNYQDDRVEAELGFAGKQTQWRLGYNLSLFRNEDSSVTFDNPGASNRNRMSLAPSNTAHSFFTDGGHQFSDSTRLTTNLSYSQYLQDDTFLPYSLNQTNDNGGPLPRNSLDGRIATTTANVELVSRPLPRLDTKTRYRFTNRRNDTAVSEFIIISSDGAGVASPVAADSNRRRRNTPYSYQENLGSLDLGYALTPRTKLTGGYEFREFERTHSERAKNIDHTGYMGARTSLAEGLTGNAKYSRMWRDGSAYSPTGSLAYTNPSAYAVGANQYDNNPGLRKYYEADLIRDRVQTGINYMPFEGLTLGVSGGLIIDEYVRSELGLTDSIATTGTLDASYQASPDLTLNSFYTYERRVTDQAGQEANVSQLSDSARKWWVNIAEDAHTAGLGSAWKIREGWKLLTDYSFVWTVTETDPTRNSGVTATAASFPDIISKTHNISARAEYDLTDNVVVGFGYALEIYRSKDWALDPVSNESTSATSLMTLSETNPNYNAHLFLVTTRAKF